MHFVKNLWQIRRDTCNFYVTFIFRSVPTWRLPKNRQNLTFQISILLHTRNASFQCLSWLSEPCAVLASSASTLPHVACYTKVREEPLVTTHSALRYVIRVHSGQAARSSRAAFPFCSAVWVYHKHWRYQTSQGRTRKCSCAGWPRSSAQKSELSVYNVPLLKYEGEQCALLSYCLLQCWRTHS